jgi:hypothetical protein
MQWLMPFVGFDWRYRKFESTKKTNLFDRAAPKTTTVLLSVGFNYTLPMLSVFRQKYFKMAMCDYNQCGKTPLTSPVAGVFMINTDKEYMAA